MSLSQPILPKHPHQFQVEKTFGKDTEEQRKAVKESTIVQKQQKKLLFQMDYTSVNAR